MSKYQLKGLIFSKGYFSLRDFSTKAGISYHRLKRLLNGETKFTIDDIRIICEELNTSPIEIFFAEWVQKLHIDEKESAV